MGERVCLPLCAFTLNDILIPLLIYSLAHKRRCFGHEVGASGISGLYSAKRCGHAIMKLLTFGAKSQFQQCAANMCRMAPHFSLHFQFVAFRFSESHNPRAQVRFVI